MVKWRRCKSTLGTTPPAHCARQAGKGRSSLEILLLEDLAPDASQWLAARYRVDYRPELAHDRAALQAALYKVNAIVAPPSLKINSQLLDYAPRLYVVARIHDGTENIDFEACQKRHVRVIQASSATVRASAEYLLSTLLQLARQGVRRRREPNEPPQPRRPGREINDSVVGLLGMSPPAHMLATMLVALGARVVGYDPAVHRSADLWRRLGVQPMGLNEMLEVADGVSLQMNYASRYRGLLNDRVLASCKRGQSWTSISRPALFDLPALAEALKDGRIYAFMMDSEDERLHEPDSPLAGLPNLRITPRLAPFTQESMLRGSWFLADRIHEALAVGEMLATHKPDDDSAPMPLT